MPVAKGSPLVPDFAVAINGQVVPFETQAHLVQIVVELDVDLPGMFQLQFSAADDQDKTARLVDQQLFNLGNAVEIRLGYLNNLQKVITGEITGLEPEFSQHRLPMLQVRGFDRLFHLQRGRKSRTYMQLKDSDIASQIAGEAGLSASVVDSKVQHPHIYQHNQTDYEFLVGRARLINYEILAEDKTLFFRPRSVGVSPVLTLTLDDDLLEFSPRLSSMHQVTEFQVQGWDVKNKKAITSRAASADQVSKMGGQKSAAEITGGAFGAAADKLTAGPVLSQAEADQYAAAEFNEGALAFIEAEGKCYGHPELKPGSVIKVDGIGKQFSGNYYLTSVRHRYAAQGGFHTLLAARRNAA